MRALAGLDPVKFEVIRSALHEATEEMALALRRTAYSTNIKTRADFSCAFFDANLNVVAQAFTQPVHLGGLAELVPRVIRAYGPERLGPGDAIVTNDPYLGGAHLNDITLISPVYAGGWAFGYVVNLAHHVDVGGGAPASVGAFREVYQEGVIIPPVKLVQGGQIVAEVFQLILAQIRSKRETAGDLRAQTAANHVGVRRIGEVLQRWGPEVVSRYIEAILEYTEERSRVGLQRLPKGTFQAEGVVDNDGFTPDPVVLKAAVTISADGVVCDLSGSDPQRRAPVNSTFSQTFSACAYVVKCLIDPDVVPNSGFYRLIRVVAPPGSIVNCLPPAPVVGGWETHVRLTEVLLKALAPALPDRIPAGTKGMMCHAGFGGVDPHTGEYFCFLETLAGGYGGRASLDGPDAVQVHGQNTENAPVEEVEAGYPVRIARYELVADSEGAGRWRGGLGLRRDYEFPSSEVRLTILADRDRWGPWGLFGGQPGARARYLLISGGEEKELSSKVTLDVKPGEIISYRTCGGGGYGPPAKRDPRAVLRDVRERRITRERARSVYGVVIE
jgi:N-methylhydantoinase B